MVSRMRFSVALFSLPLSLLIGCGFSSKTPIVSSSNHISGKIFGGQNPISGSTVTVWQVVPSDYGYKDSTSAIELATTTSASDGTFDIPLDAYSCSTPDAQVYITAAGGNATPDYDNPAIMLATGLGNCSSAKTQNVEINEVTTVVTAFALNWFYSYDLGSAGNYFAAPAADMGALAMSNAHTIPTLVNLPDGTVNPNTAAITIEAAKIYTLANTLAACVNSTASTSSTACGNLFSDTTDPYSGAIPSDTLQAAVVIATYPYQNISDLYNMGVPQAPFVGLGSAPNDWTIGVSYTTSSLGLGIANTPISTTSASIDIDTNGRIWVPSNLPGSTGVGYFDPTAGTFSGPFLTGTFTQPQYVAIDGLGLIWITDVSSPAFGYVNTASPGAANDASTTIVGGLSSGPISIDPSNNVLFSYLDTSNAPNLAALVGDPESGYTGSGIGAFTDNPTGLVVDYQDYVTASTSGLSTPCNSEEMDPDTPYFDNYVDESTTSSCTSGGMALAVQDSDNPGAATTANQICYYALACSAPPVPVNLPEGVATDGIGDEWLANSGNGSISVYGGYSSYGQISPIAYLHDSTHGNTMTKPYGIAIDGSGDVWVANASCVSTGATACTPTSFTLSEVIGVAGPTIEPLSAQEGGGLAGTLPGDPPTPDVATHALQQGKTRHHSAANAKPLVNSNSNIILRLPK